MVLALLLQQKSGVPTVCQACARDGRYNPKQDCLIPALRELIVPQGDRHPTNNQSHRQNDHGCTMRGASSRSDCVWGQGGLP